MTEQEFKVINTIQEHSQNVGAVVLKVCEELMRRALTHDASKLSAQELEDNFKALPDKWRIQAQGHGYHSDEQEKHRKKFAAEIHRHRSTHPHHPEYFGNDVNKMNLIDLIEMLCDWYVSSVDIDESIRENSSEYKIDPHISQILENTALTLKEIAPKQK